MIAYLEGTVLYSDDKEVVIKASTGIGYKVFTNQFFSVGSFCQIYTVHIFKENGQDLYGVKNLEEKKMFEMLLEVKGVGPKSAFALISSFRVDEIIQFIAFDNKKALSKAPGIGPKAAAQIVLDLSEKIKKFDLSTRTNLGLRNRGEQEGSPKMGELTVSILRDIVLAGKELGFAEEKVEIVARKIIEKQNDIGREELLKKTLREISL